MKLFRIRKPNPSLCMIETQHHVGVQQSHQNPKTCEGQGSWIGCCGEITFCFRSPPRGAVCSPEAHLLCAPTHAQTQQRKDTGMRFEITLGLAALETLTQIPTLETYPEPYSETCSDCYARSRVSTNFVITPWTHKYSREPASNAHPNPRAWFVKCCACVSSVLPFDFLHLRTGARVIRRSGGPPVSARVCVWAFARA